MDLDAKLCYCFHVTKRKVVNFVRQRRPKRASQVSECFGAGTGCGWCVPFLIKIHREIVGNEAVESDDITPEQYEAMRANYREDVRCGKRRRNEYSEAESAASGAGAGADAEEEHREDDAYTRYFSRTRPDPRDDVERRDPPPPAHSSD